VRPLGARAVRAWAAIETLPDGKTRLAVVEKVTRGGDLDDQEIADWIRDARRLATMEHPNLGRVRDVIIRDDEILVVSDYLDGALWSELGSKDPRPGLEMSLRVLLDVLLGLSAMHNLRDAKREPLHVVHGELTPDCLVVGLDGGARVIRPCRTRGDGNKSGRSANAYLAPEILLGDESADARADVYGVGAMLWEALSGKPLFANTQASAIVTTLLSGRIPRATVPEASPWAAPLVDVAARAMSADPEKRFGSAASLAAELRRVAGAKLAPTVRVAGLVRGAYGDRIRARRGEIERGETRPERETREVVVAPAEESFEVDVDVRVSSVPTPVPPSLVSTRPPPPIEPTAAPVKVQALAPPFPPPRAPPLLRPRLPTLEGVAPQAPPTSAASPVVVPPSSRPPPPLVVPVPEPAIVPAPVPPPDLALALEPMHAPPLSPLPVPPMVMTPLATPVAVRPRRSMRIALLVGPAVCVVALLVWWLASRSDGPQADATPQPSAPTAVVSTTPPAAEPPPPPPASTQAAPEPPIASAEPTPPPAAQPTAEAPAAEPSTGAAPVPPPVVMPQGVVAPPAAPPRPAPRRKYEPEGI